MHLKKSFFYLILILIPFLLVTAAELILKAVNYGDDLSLVAVVEHGGKKYYTLNQLAGKRYFDKDRLYYRKGIHDFFEIEKEPNTVRIFCFGESTTAGFPYEYNAVPAEFLRTMLGNSLPGKNIEVINTAIAATNSFTVAQFTEELIKYQPDLYVVYLGQNEFYGAFGVGSVISIGTNRQLIKAYLWLQQFKTFLLLKDIISSVTGLFKNEREEEEVLLMEQMAENNSISSTSSDYLTAKETFEKNYVEIIRTAVENGIPLLVSTLVTNEKDLPPFISIYTGDLSPELKRNRDNFFRRGSEAEKKKDYYSALEYFSEAVKIDSMPAFYHYELARCYERTGDFKKAKEEYIRAKDLDGLRFRAPSDFNDIIRKLAGKSYVILADQEKSFRKNSENEIIGNRLLTDHVHPNVEGYFLLAKTWFNAVKEKNLFGISDQSVLNDSILMDQCAVTNLDRTIGELKILKLKNEPPFSTKKKKFEFSAKNKAEEIAFRYVIKREMSWAEAHLEMAAYFEEKNETEKALKEYDAILVTDENNPYVIKLKGDLFFSMENYGRAEEFYLQAFRLSEEPAVSYKLGLTNMRLEKPEIAVRFMKYSLQPENTSRFSPEELEEIRYNMALAYKDLNMVAYAVRELKIILDNNPSNNAALILLTELESQ